MFIVYLNLRRLTFAIYFAIVVHVRLVWHGSRCHLCTIFALLLIAATFHWPFHPRARQSRMSMCVQCVLFGVVDTSWVWKRNDKDQLSEHTIQYSICIQVVLYSDLYHLQQCYCHLHICYSLLWSQVHKVPSLPTLNSCSAAHGNDLQMTMTVAS